MASASLSPSLSPSMSPSASPSMSPSMSASLSPSLSPSMSPSVSPSASPSAIPAGLVNYTIRRRLRLGKMHKTYVQISWGGANERYPSGGVPLDTNQLGMTSYVDAVIILESDASVYLFDWDKSANTIRIFSEARVELVAAVQLPTLTIEVMAEGY